MEDYYCADSSCPLMQGNEPKIGRLIEVAAARTASNVPNSNLLAGPDSLVV